MSTPAATATDDFVRHLTVEAAPAALLAAVSTADGVSGWWFPTTSPRPGQLRVAMGDSRVEVTVRTSANRVGWDVTDCPVEPDWVGTSIEFEVTPVAAGSALLFTHHGLAALPCLEVCTAGWSHYLPSLAAYAATGTGTPGPRQR